MQDLYMNVYNIFHSTQNMETIQMSVDEWHNKMWYIHTEEQLAVKRNEDLIHTKAWMNLKQYAKVRKAS